MRVFGRVFGRVCVRACACVSGPYGQLMLRVRPFNFLVGGGGTSGSVAKISEGGSPCTRGSYSLS